MKLKQQEIPTIRQIIFKLNLITNSNNIIKRLIIKSKEFKNYQVHKN